MVVKAQIKRYHHHPSIFSHKQNAKHLQSVTDSTKGNIHHKAKPQQSKSSLRSGI